MGGPTSGVSKRRRSLPTRFRDGSALARADGRARDVRAIRDGVRAILADSGGEDAASFLRRRVACRAMFLDQLLSRDELALTQGQEIDRHRYIQSVQAWHRLVAQLGLARVPRNVETLADYARRIASETGGTSVP